MDSKKWNQLVEYIINEDRESANALFHDIVVEKSREIYEAMMDEPGDEVDGLAADIEDEETGSDDGETMDVPGDEDSELELELDAEGDEDEDELEGEEELDSELEGDLEDRVVDMEEKVDRIDALMAKFQDIMDGKAEEEIGAEEEGEGMEDMMAGAEEEEEGAEEFGAGEEEEAAGEDEAARAMMEALQMQKVSVKKHQAVSDMGPVAGKNTDIKTGAHAVNYSAGGPAKGGSSKARQMGQSFANQPGHGSHMTKVSQHAAAGGKSGAKSPVAKRGK